MGAWQRNEGLQTPVGVMARFLMMLRPLTQR
jgi:hypothetical protein